MNDELRQKYEFVINSFRWRAIKARLIRERGYRCQHCRRIDCTLEMHHSTYERLGEERDDDLELLCYRCHQKADAERAERGRTRANRALYEAQLEGWVRAKYGDDFHGDWVDAADEFDEWKESHDG